MTLPPTKNYQRSGTINETGSMPTLGVCAGCKTSGVNLLVCDDFAGDGSPTKSRFCSSCMLGKKVRVFWPLDEQWYVGVVQEYDQSTGEHLLRYPDGDTEWVKIGENGPTSGGNNGLTSPGGTSIMQSRSREMSERVCETSPESQQPYNGIHPSEIQRKGDSGSPHKRRGYGDQASVGGDGPVPRGHPSHYQGGIHHYPVPYGSVGGHPPPGMPPPPYGSPYAGGGYPPSGPYGFPPSMHMMGHVSPGSPEEKRGGKEIDHPPSNVGSSQTSSGSGTKRKSGPKTWTKEEDALLLNMVQNMRMPMKWSLVAQSMPDRTGKQCRERYVNHLNPRLKSTDWSPSEDAKIFHLYNTCGSQWAKMSKMIPGRTDNGIKNRFHNLRRQLEREDEHRVRLSKPEDFPDQIRLERLRTFPNHLRGKCDELWDMSNGIGVLAAQSVVGGSFARNAGRFGPFKTADSKGEQCARCGLFAPSTQCGNEICTRSKWCQACTRIPPHMCNNLLRECLNLRRSQDTEKGKIEESWDEEIRS